ncbi:helix-turn-helix domain-containing protein [Pseudothauera nasutitermitis]|uniref:Helix-turn-helix domain-containing protein n=1 Tax=Pseudothauera nasutitermitis TaxID=2565930 RepID=A0A4V3WCJ1_9RHOO|nr:helix-turn-helix transcriptional regulator [Pseudothauera nasutitermitis]THF67374.1 helix-turn-helix domain-containing protein [Pseudothauera nasutitermitis]
MNLLGEPILSAAALKTAAPATPVFRRTAPAAPLAADPDAQIAQSVGINLRRLRTQHQLSLDALARLSGVSRAMLGQVELGRSVPSITVLYKVARALEVPVTSFLGARHEPGNVVLRAAETRVVLSARGKVSTRALFPADPPTRTEFFELRLSRLAEEHLPASPPGTRANLVVVHGSVAVVVGEEEYPLATGDAIQFIADEAHAFRNLADSDALLYLVKTYPRADG